MISWNALLNQRFADMFQRSGPVFLYVDADLLGDISGLEPEEAVKSFVSYFGTSDPKSTFDIAYDSAKAWKSNGFSGPNPAAAVLALTVLAVVESTSEGEKSVYRWLNKHLSEDHSSKTTPGYEKAPEIWKIFNEYLDALESGAEPTASEIGRYTRQGWARSQALFTPNERKTLVIPFLEAYRGEWVKDFVLRHLMLYLSGQSSADRLLSRLQPDPPSHTIDDELVFDVLDRLRNDEERLQRSIDGKTKDRSSVLRGGLLRCLTFQEDVDDALSVVVIVDGIKVQTSLKALNESMGTSLSSTQFEIYLTFEDLDLLFDGGKKLVNEEMNLGFASRKAIPMKLEPSWGGLLETKDFTKADYFLVKDEGLSLASGRGVSGKGIPAIAGFTWVVADQESILEFSRPHLVPRKSLLFCGGLPLNKVSHTYLRGWPPYVTSRDTSESEKIRVNDRLINNEMRSPIDAQGLSEIRVSFEKGMPSYLLSFKDFSRWPTKDLNVSPVFFTSLQERSNNLLAGPSRIAELTDAIEVRPTEICVIVNTDNEAYFAQPLSSVNATGDNPYKKYLIRRKYFEDQVSNSRLLIKLGVHNNLEFFELAGQANHSNPDSKRNAIGWLRFYSEEFRKEITRTSSVTVKQTLWDLVTRLLSVPDRPEVAVHAKAFCFSGVLAPASRTQPTSGNPYDVLLHFISERASASISQLAEAWQSINQGLPNGSKSDIWAALAQLERSGHILIARGSRVEVQICRPTLVPLERVSLFSLVGFRTPKYLEWLSNEISVPEATSDVQEFMMLEHRSSWSEVDGWTGPTRIYIEFDRCDVEALQENLLNSELFLVEATPEERLNRLPNWSDFLSSRESESMAMPEGERTSMVIVSEQRKHVVRYVQPISSSQVDRFVSQFGFPVWAVRNANEWVLVDRNHAAWRVSQGHKVVLRSRIDSLELTDDSFIPNEYWSVLSSYGLQPNASVLDSQPRLTKVEMRGTKFENLTRRFSDRLLEKLGVQEIAED